MVQIEAAGHEIVQDNNVDDAQALLDAGSFDLLICDILLPHKDGTQLMKYVRHSGMDMPIIAITGGLENAQDDYQNFADLFADETLVKPIKKDDLIASVKKLAS